MIDLSADLPKDRNESRRYESSPLLYSDATYNVRDFTLQEDNESLDESYGDGSPNEICAFKLDQEKIDEYANDYRAETCVSSSRESTIQKESYKETVKSDGTPSWNEDESRCKSNRKRKTRRKTPEGVIIDLSNDVYGTCRSGIRISVISTHNLIPEIKFVAAPKKQYSMRNPSSRSKEMKKMIDSSVLAVVCAENCRKTKKTQRSTKRRCNLNNILHIRNANTTVDVSRELENLSNKRNNTPSLCTPREILDSAQYCHRNDALVDIDNARYPILNTEQTCVGARKRIANCYCSIFNDEHQEYHICDRQDYNTDGSNFNAEMRADWTAGCFHPEYIRLKGCGCSCDSSECDPNINIQRDRRSLMSRATKLLENSTLPRKYQREEDDLRTDIAPEFATGADEYSSDGVKRCTNCDGVKARSASTIRKRVSSKTSIPSGSVFDLGNTRPTDASRCEIDTHPGKHGWWTTTTATAGRDGDRSYKSDSVKAADTWDARAWRDNCIKRRCSGSDQHPGEKDGSARGVGSEWKRGSMETDAQQLDYKWKRKIATVDVGTRAGLDFKGKRDFRYKSKEAIRVQLRESAEIRKRESLEMVEATSQTRSDNINVDGKHPETRDYSLWTSLQMGKIWSQVHNACKNVVKLAATSVARVVKDAPKSERSPRNLVEVADATLVESSSSCAGKICGETCRKNLMRSTSGEKTEEEMRQERTIGDVGKYRGDTEATMWKNSRAIAPSCRDVWQPACRNAEKVEDGDSCANYSKRERDRYQDITEFPPRSETYSRDEDVHSRSRLNEPITYLEKFTYPGLRSRGGGDNNRDFAKGIRADTSVASRKNPQHHELRSNVSRLEDRRVETPDRTRLCGETETCDSIEDTVGAKTERRFMSAIADAAVSSKEADPTVHSSRNEPNEPIASTSKRETLPDSPGKSRRDRPGFKSLFCARAKKFWRRRSSVDNKTAEREGLDSTATSYNIEAKITQIKPSTDAREGNKRQVYVEVQIPDAIVTRILSEFLGDETKGRVLMNIILHLESDHDGTEARTQTSDVTSGGINVFSCPDRCPPDAIETASKMVQCFVCGKQDCYEIRQSDNSISLEEALIAEYPETNESNDCLAHRRANISP